MRTGYYLLYDGGCGYCRRFKDLACRLAPARLTPVELTSRDGARLLAGVEPLVAFGSFHLTSEDGELHSGARALPLLLSVVVPSRLVRRIVATAASRKLLGKVYAVVSRMVGSKCDAHDPYSKVRARPIRS